MGVITIGTRSQVYSKDGVYEKAQAIMLEHSLGEITTEEAVEKLNSLNDFIPSDASSFDHNLVKKIIKSCLRAL